MCNKVGDCADGLTMLHKKLEIEERQKMDIGLTAAKMAENEMIYFLYGYIYAQAEQIVKEFYPTLSDGEFRKKVMCVHKMMIHNLIRKERDSDGRENG
jgi:hypothetical protein